MFSYTLLWTVHVDLANTTLGGGIQWTGKDCSDEHLVGIMFLPVRDHSTVVWADPYSSGPLPKDDVGALKDSTLRQYSIGEDCEKGGEGIELQQV